MPAKRHSGFIHAQAGPSGAPSPAAFRPDGVGTEGDDPALANVPLPHPAEDLSADDDLLSWILVDQLGAMPGARLGVHPQQPKFVGPPFKTEEVMTIIHETIIKGDISKAIERLLSFHLIQSHMTTKRTPTQRDRFVSHLRRYLNTLMPTSKVDIHTTDRYSHVTGHTELAVYATRPLRIDTVVDELQGSVVPLPEEWLDEIDLGEEFAREAAGDESESDSEGEDQGKPKRMARRSDRTKRRDFSIVWSSMKKCYQLFLGPARFLNHDCNPNVELLRQGKYVTFKVKRHIRIGEEVTTFYGPNYFGKANIECLCLTCEKNQTGGFTPKDDVSEAPTPNEPMSPAASTSAARLAKRKASTSSLRHPLRPDEDEDEAIASTAPTPATDALLVDATTPSSNGNSTSASLFAAKSNKDTDTTVYTPPDDCPMDPQTPAAFTEVSEGDLGDENDEEGSGSESEESVVQRTRYERKATKKAKAWEWWRKKPKHKPIEAETSQLAEDDDLPEDFPRCATCAKPLMERMWFLGRYFDHCARCTRHALIFELPWPAHRLEDVQDYPPSHLLPNGYIPPRISTIPLPSLSKQPKKKLEPLLSPTAFPGRLDVVSKEHRAAIRFRMDTYAEEFVAESLRTASWTEQEAAEMAVVAEAQRKEDAIKRKEEARRLREEEKRKRDEHLTKGTGLWSKYEIIDEAAYRQRILEKTTLAPEGGRRRTFVGSYDENDRKKRPAPVESTKPSLPKGVPAVPSGENVPTPTTAGGPPRPRSKSTASAAARSAPASTSRSPSAAKSQRPLSKIGVHGQRLKRARVEEPYEVRQARTQKARDTLKKRFEERRRASLPLPEPPRKVRLISSSASLHKRTNSNKEKGPSRRGSVRTSASPGPSDREESDDDAGAVEKRKLRNSSREHTAESSDDESIQYVGHSNTGDKSSTKGQKRRRASRTERSRKGKERALSPQSDNEKSSSENDDSADGDFVDEDEQPPVRVSTRRGKRVFRSAPSSSSDRDSPSPPRRRVTRSLRRLEDGEPGSSSLVESVSMPNLFNPDTSPSATTAKSGMQGQEPRKIDDTRSSTGPTEHEARETRSANARSSTSPVASTSTAKDGAPRVSPTKLRLLMKKHEFSLRATPSKGSSDQGPGTQAGATVASTSSSPNKKDRGRPRKYPLSAGTTSVDMPDASSPALGESSATVAQPLPSPIHAKATAQTPTPSTSKAAATAPSPSASTNQRLISTAASFREVVEATRLSLAASDKLFQASLRLGPVAPPSPGFSKATPAASAKAVTAPSTSGASPSKLPTLSSQKISTPAKTGNTASRPMQMSEKKTKANAILPAAASLPSQSPSHTQSNGTTPTRAPGASTTVPTASSAKVNGINSTTSPVQVAPSPPAATQPISRAGQIRSIFSSAPAFFDNMGILKLAGLAPSSTTKALATQSQASSSTANTNQSNISSSTPARLPNVNGSIANGAAMSSASQEFANKSPAESASPIAKTSSTLTLGSRPSAAVRPVSPVVSPRRNAATTTIAPARTPNATASPTAPSQVQHTSISVQPPNANGPTKVASNGTPILSSLTAPTVHASPVAALQQAQAVAPTANTTHPVAAVGQKSPSPSLSRSQVGASSVAGGNISSTSTTKQADPEPVYGVELTYGDDLISRSRDQGVFHREDLMWRLAETSAGRLYYLLSNAPAVEMFGRITRNLEQRKIQATQSATGVGQSTGQPILQSSKTDLMKKIEGNELRKSIDFNGSPEFARRVDHHSMSDRPLHSTPPSITPKSPVGMVVANDYHPTASPGELPIPTRTTTPPSTNKATSDLRSSSTGKVLGNERFHPYASFFSKSTIGATAAGHSSSPSVVQRTTVSSPANPFSSFGSVPKPFTSPEKQAAAASSSSPATLSAARPNGSSPSQAAQIQNTSSSFTSARGAFGLPEIRRPPAEPESAGRPPKIPRPSSPDRRRYVWGSNAIGPLQHPVFGNLRRPQGVPAGHLSTADAMKSFKSNAAASGGAFSAFLQGGQGASSSTSVAATARASTSTPIPGANSTSKSLVAARSASQSAVTTAAAAAARTLPWRERVAEELEAIRRPLEEATARARSRSKAARPSDKAPPPGQPPSGSGTSGGGGGGSKVFSPAFLSPDSAQKAKKHLSFQSTERDRQSAMRKSQLFPSPKTATTAATAATAGSSFDAASSSGATQVSHPSTVSQ